MIAVTVIFSHLFPRNSADNLSLMTIDTSSKNTNDMMSKDTSTVGSSSFTLSSHERPLPRKAPSRYSVDSGMDSSLSKQEAKTMRNIQDLDKPSHWNKGDRSRIFFLA